MSRYTYAGEYKNPCTNMYVKEVGDHFEVWVRSDRDSDGSAPPDHKHSSAPNFDEAGDADEYITDLHDGFEEDYDNYLEENRYEINLMERYEAFKNEY